MNFIKTFSLACAVMAQAHLAAHAMQDNDTLVVKKPSRVLVISSDSLQTVVIEGSESNKNYKYQNTIQLVDSNYVSTSAINEDTWDFGFNILRRKKKGGSKGQVVTNLLLGFCSAPGMPQSADIRPFSSWEIWWIIADTFIYPWGKTHQLSAGIGIDWRNYRMSDEMRFVKGTDGMSIQPYPDDAHPKFSRVKVFSVNFPIRYHFNTKYFRVSLGPVINLNTYSSIKTRYTLNGEKVKDVSKDVRATPVTVDFMGTLYFRGLEFYVKYSPCNVIKSSYGPKFHSLSFGLGI